VQREGIKDFNPANPRHAWALRKELAAYSRWWAGQRFGGYQKQQVSGMDARLADHLAFAQELLGSFPLEISGVLRKHQLKLADRQCRMAELSQRVQDAIILVVTALWGHEQRDPVAVAAADLLCQDLRRKVTGQRPTDRYFRDAAALADMIIGGGFQSLAGVPHQEILMKYENR